MNLNHLLSLTIPVSTFYHVHMSTIHFRLIVGAPRGTYPGGLSLTDPAKPHENRTGLVYSCPSAGSDMCEGVRGNTTIYIGPDVNANITNGVQLDLISFSQAFNPDITEGRLFDQARKFSETFMSILIFDLIIMYV